MPGRFTAGLVASAHRRPGYPSSGCVPAGPDSVSPGGRNLSPNGLRVERWARWAAPLLPVFFFPEQRRDKGGPGGKKTFPPGDNPKRGEAAFLILFALGGGRGPIGRPEGTGAKRSPRAPDRRQPETPKSRPENDPSDKDEITGRR